MSAFRWHFTVRCWPIFGDLHPTDLRVSVTYNSKDTDAVLACSNYSLANSGSQLVSGRSDESVQWRQKPLHWHYRKSGNEQLTKTSLQTTAGNSHRDDTDVLHKCSTARKQRTKRFSITGPSAADICKPGRPAWILRKTTPKTYVVFCYYY